MKIHALLTPSDWFHFFGTATDLGLERASHLLAEAGLSQLYLRTHDGGLANFPSETSPPLIGRNIIQFAGQFATLPHSYSQYMALLDYSNWNPFPPFLEAAEKAGLSPGLWYTLLEDDHGGPFKTPFLHANPQFQCMDRSGERIEGCLDFWFPEVRAYKRSIVEELLAQNPRRLLLDLVRRNGKPSSDAAGFYRYGFNPEIVSAFADATGLDALALEPGSPDWYRWLDFVSAPVTEFFVDLCRLIHGAGVAVELLTWPVNLKEWLGIDLTALAATGTVAAVHVAAHTYSSSPAEIERQLAAIGPQVQAHGVPVIPSISAYGGLTATGLDSYFAAAQKHGVEAIVVHESDAILRNRMSTRFRALNYGVPHYQRELHAPYVAGPVDWAQVPTCSGFLRGYNEPSVEADQLTELQVAYTNEALHVRFICHERDTASLLPVPGWPRDNYNVLQLGARMRWNPMESVHLILSLPAHFNDFYHVQLDPSEGKSQEQRLDETWSAPWQGEAAIGNDRWTAEFQLPFTSLGLTPAAGVRFPFHALRVQSSPRQVTMWNLAGTNIINPDEFGFLVLD